MVYQDIYSKNENSNVEVFNSPAQFYLADPIDRAAAFIIDSFVILLPVLMLSNAPFKRIMFSSILLDNNLDFAFSLIFGVFTTVFTITLYHTLSTYLLGASLGKLFLGIKVVDLWSHKKPSFTSCLLRACAWWLGAITIGFSYASVFTNERRRALHDRISETIVVCKKNRLVSKPSFYESSIVKGVFAGFLAFVFVVVTIILFKTHRDLSKHSQIANLLEEKRGLCGAVGSAYREWPDDLDGETPRLEVAMTLFAAGSIGEDCLEAEASFILRQDIKSPLAYLAKSFVYSDRPKLSDSYLQRVCEIAQDSYECHMSEIVRMWDKEEWESLSAKFVKIDEGWPAYIRVWAIRNAINQGDFIFARALFDRIPSLDSLKYFVINFKTKTHIFTENTDHLEHLTDLAFTSLEEGEKINLATWLCYHQLSLGCQKLKSQSCQFFGNNFDIKLLSNTLYSLATVKKNYCENKRTDISQQIPRGVVKIIEALGVLANDKTHGLEKLWSIYDNKEVKVEIREEAARYYVENAQIDLDFDKLLIYWKPQIQNLEWQKTGYTLFRKLIDQRSYAMASEVGMALFPYYENNELYKKQLALSFFKAGENQKAWEIISKNYIPFTSRSPASMDMSYDEMVQILKEEFIRK